ncbi:MAG: A/G-specific adenine glycosylase [Candidatus Omnitrophica bacterium]|nr:A/G-specific adenine glycosylase [Candidatus Omnitrophota bacterium]
MPIARTVLFQKYLLRWYKRNARQLPWRKTKNPYKIWVSEIMLQQTQVETVIPFYKKWCQTFPSVRTLANTPAHKVMRLWAGLGYYRRARALHQTAKIIVEKHKSKLPVSVKDLMKLPGIGRYTAGAIASIAFGKTAPVLDGNVIRVLTRLHAISNPIDSPMTIRKLWEMAESMVPKNHAGDFNQAMMELGAMICRPDSPKCGICPVSKFCSAYRKNMTKKIPYRLKKERIKKITSAALIFQRDGKVLVQKQPRDGRWGSLWMFPFWENKKDFLKEAGSGPKNIRHKFTIRHGFTKYSINLQVFSSRTFRPLSLWAKPLEKKNQWVSIRNLGKLAFPSPHRKIAEFLLEESFKEQ